MDLLHQGIAENSQAVHDYLEDIGNVRNPSGTPILDDLEREFGVTPSDGMSDATRRAVLATKMFSRGLKGQYWVLQNAINQAGFTGITVIPNNPAVDPTPFVTGAAQMVAGGYNGYAGRTDAFAAFYGGMLIVNGPQYINTPNVVGCGSGMVSCHPIAAGLQNTNICGSFFYSQSQILNFGVPIEPYKWPFFFFIGGTPTFDGSGKLTALTQCTIPLERMNEFLSLVLHYKPQHSWGALIYSN